VTHPSPRRQPGFPVTFPRIRGGGGSSPRFQPRSLGLDYAPGALALDPQLPTTLYAAAGGAILTSTDAGATWQSRVNGLPSPPNTCSRSQCAELAISLLAVDPQQSGTVYAGSWGTTTQGENSPDRDKGIFKTTDGGLTWNRASPEFPVIALAVDPARPATIYAGVDQRDYRIAKSTDGGQTWAIAG
jgi:photosystem II stability/assembly factor-like uncharacterized protein